MDAKTYSDKAHRTANLDSAGVLARYRRSKEECLKRVYKISKQSEKMEDLKKIIFYGKDTPMTTVVEADAAIQTLKERPEVANQLALMHGTFGLCGELGEVLQAVDKVPFQSFSPESCAKVVDEAGDLLWYLNEILLACGSDMSQAMAKNIAKLEARYPSGAFSTEAVLNKDEAVEAKAQESVE